MVNLILKITLLLLLLSNISLAFSDSNVDNYANTSKGKAFITEMTGQFGYTEHELKQLFSQVSRDETILKKISRPAEKVLLWYQYRRIFLDNKRINNGINFYKKHEKVLREAYEKYGVSPAIIVAILGVETRYGKVTGRDKVITALATIGFDYASRGRFFTKQLRAFLQMAKQENFDPLKPLGSYAGAMGMPQFMPSSYLHYAVDYEGDGKKDLWTNANDVIFSVANYLAKNGWQRDGLIADKVTLPLSYQGQYNGKSFTTWEVLKQQGIAPKQAIIKHDERVGLLQLEGKKMKQAFVIFKNFNVITTYNNSPLYAMAVSKLSEAIQAGL